MLWSILSIPNPSFVKDGLRDIRVAHCYFESLKWGSPSASDPRAKNTGQRATKGTVLTSQSSSPWCDCRRLCSTLASWRWQDINVGNPLWRRTLTVMEFCNQIGLHMHFAGTAGTVCLRWHCWRTVIQHHGPSVLLTDSLACSTASFSHISSSGVAIPICKDGRTWGGGVVHTPVPYFSSRDMVRHVTWSGSSLHRHTATCDYVVSEPVQSHDYSMIITLVHILLQVTVHIHSRKG